MYYTNLVPNVQTSALGLGMVRYEQYDKDMFRNIDYAIEQGVNYIEACWFYLDGQCESRLATALSRHKRDSYILVDKMPMGALKTMTPDEFFPQQLKNCNTDYFDMYMLQALDRNSFSLIDKYNVLDFIDKKKKEGIVGHLGFSFHDTPEYLEKYLQMYNWDFVQLQLNYYDWFWTKGKELYEMADKYNTNIVVMGPVKGGTLVKNLPIEAIRLLNDLDHTRSTASWAMRFLAGLPRVKVILTGAEHFDMLQENISLFDNPNGLSLTQEEIDTLEKVVNIYREKNYIACTGCGYCKCPRGINIPKVFSLYNQLVKEYTDEKWEEMLKVIKNEAWATTCVGCKQCEKMCPQHLPIQQYMYKRLFHLRA